MVFGKNNGPKQIKKKKPASASEKSEIAKRYDIRISTPNGYYPEDVDKILKEMEDVIAQQDKEIQMLSKDRDQARKDLGKLQAEFTKFKLSITTMDIKDNSFEDDIQDIAKINDIAGIKKPASVEIDRSDDDLDMVGLLDVNPQPQKPSVNRPINSVNLNDDDDDDLEIIGL